MSIIQGDCLQELPKLSENSVDLLVTDPPYGYSFMGKDWDKVVVSSDVWKECLRVLKPGAFAFIMSSPRQDVLSKMIVNLIEAGFETNFTSLYWVYASGFPKAANVGKLADKRNGKPQRSIDLEQYLTSKIREKYGRHYKLAEEMGVDEALIRHWIGKSGTQFLIPTEKQYDILKDKLGLDDRFDWLIEWEEAKRNKIPSTGNLHKNDLTHGWSKMKPKDECLMSDDNPITKQAQRLDGSYAGYQPKPAVEVILVCMKPLSEKTYVDQALSNNKGISWLDDCRIPYQSSSDVWSRDCNLADMRGNNYGNDEGKRIEGTNDQHANEKGRFPANLLVEDDVLNDGRSYVGRKHDPSKNPAKSIFGSPMEYSTSEHGPKDEGSFSRYFSLDAWAEKTLPFLIVPKASRAEKNKGLEGYNQEVKLKPVIEKETKVVRKNEPSKEEISTYLKHWRTKHGISSKDIAKHFPSQSGGITGCVWNWENCVCLPMPDEWLRLKQLIGFDDKYDKQMTEMVDVRKSDTMTLTKFPQVRTGYASIPNENRHPTVKPLKLMSYLITMGSRPNDIILDPFCGSGTTGIAALQLGRRFIGMELNEEYTQIARKRLQPYLQQTKLPIVGE